MSGEENTEHRAEDARYRAEYVNPAAGADHREAVQGALDAGAGRAAPRGPGAAGERAGGEAEGRQGRTPHRGRRRRGARGTLVGRWLGRMAAGGRGAPGPLDPEDPRALLPILDHAAYGAAWGLLFYALTRKLGGAKP